ncbi:Bacterial regulatory proteins, luxR family [Serratia quinivorans]|uniref:LuxR C-terminal-related transcriptional regulator n=1 Tax=Serratia TaxID=613 RepID=UPI001F4BDB9F|nr:MULTISPECIES: LuxR C-terminal-related transcriptional regulator [Serratia]ULG12043.1 hypothetical protein D1p1_00010 [Serratia entomophila]ULG12438.1 hypothetical protein M3p_00147 [Serratia entomophila]ULG15907.1 hypothetical protein 591p_00055 [Serratia proteamaculans]ULG18386.1 hypothetical protein Man4p_00068 [Serratia proteamaculans]ULG19640.1 hypothetical protein S-prot-1p1_00056 [Serratia proteamaculans]
MAIVDPTYLYRERNQFPSLTDKEFHTFCTYCQCMNVKAVADFNNCSESSVWKHLRSCKQKLNVSNDLDLYFLFFQKKIPFDKLYPQLSRDEVLLLAAFSFYRTRSAIAKTLGIPYKEVYFALVRIKNLLGFEDLESLRVNFMIMVTLLP